MNYDTKNVTLVKVNGYSLPQCSSYSGSLSDLDVDSGRNVNDGVMVRSRKRKGMYKLEFSYDLLPLEIAQPILNVIEPPFFDVEFYAIDKGRRITEKMYVGDRGYEWQMAIPKGKSDFEICVKDLKFNFVQK